MKRSPRIGLDLLPLSGDRTGMFWQAWWLAHWMPDLAPEFQFVFFMHDGADAPVVRSNVEVVRVRRGSRRGARVIAEQWHLPRAAAGEDLDLLHTIAYGSPVLYRGLRVLTMHDLGFRLHPETAPWRYRLYWNWAYGPAARKCRRIITVSESTRGRIIAEFGRSPDEVDVVHCGYDPAFCMVPDDDRANEAVKTLALPPRYILFVGTRQPRKDLDTLFRTFALIRARDADVHLVVAGAGGWGYSNHVSRLRELGIEEHVHITGFVDQKLMPDLYRGAQLLLFTSRHEGFGLPLVEAMASGTPVAATDNSSIPEVTGDAALLAPTGDEGALAGRVMEILQTPEMRRSLVEKGRQRARLFSWRTAAGATIGVYRKALGIDSGVGKNSPGSGVVGRAAKSS